MSDTSKALRTLAGVLDQDHHKALVRAAADELDEADKHIATLEAENIQIQKVLDTEHADAGGTTTEQSGKSTEGGT